MLFSGMYTYKGLTGYSYFWSNLKTLLLYFSGPSTLIEADFDNILGFIIKKGVNGLEITMI